LGEDGGSQKAAAVIHQGELEASLGQVHEIHLGPLSRKGLGVTDPDGFGLAGAEDQDAGSLEYPVDTAHAAGDEAGLGEVGVETADAETDLAVNPADDVQHAALESGGAAPRASATVEEAPLPLAAPGRPPASEGGVRDLRRFTEATGTQARMPATQLLEGDDVTDPCGYGPGCARLVHVGPPVDRSVVFLSAYPTVGPAFVHPLSVSHVLEHHIG
jgi:hypothetical protein